MAVTHLEVLYGSQTGDAKAFAEIFYEYMKKHVVSVMLRSIDAVDPDTFFKPQEEPSYCVFFLSTYFDGEPSKSAQWFFQWLQDLSQDFRVGRDQLQHLRYGVFGLCDSAYPSDLFNVVAKNVDLYFSDLGAKRIHACGIGDKQHDRQILLQEWTQAFVDRLSRPEEFVVSHESDLSELDNASDGGDTGSLVDMEDLGFSTLDVRDGENDLVIHPRRQNDMNRFAVPLQVSDKPMVTPELRHALTKQGYKIVGTHSGVKLCRWTKSMLRGRGG
jgi:tRNA wybutosine-synthesizing protein 1